MSGIKCRQRDIVLVPFPYSDLSGSKRRPVLVVSNNVYNCRSQDVLVCVITSNLRGDEYSVAMRNEDLEVGALPEDSLVRSHKLFTIHQDKVLRKFSVVTDEFFEKVRERIKHLIEN